MPIRTATLNKQIQHNGQRLHLAMASRVRSQGADHPPSDEEQALREERQLLKEAKAQRQALALAPKPKAAKVVKEAKPAKQPKAPKAAKEPKEPNAAKAAKSGKDHKPSRAEKLAKKAENLEAAKRASKKSAKT